MASGRQHRSVRSETEGSRRVKRAALLFPPETPVCTTNRVTKHDVGDRGRVNRRRAELFAVLSAGCSPVTVSPATRIPYFDIQNLPHRQSLDSRPNPAVQPASGELAVETHLLSELTPRKLRFTVIPSEIPAKIRTQQSVAAHRKSRSQNGNTAVNRVGRDRRGLMRSSGTGLRSPTACDWIHRRSSTPTSREYPLTATRCTTCRRTGS